MFYDVFCELCAANNLTPSGGAAAIGFNRATVTTWKNTGKAPKGDILLKVAQYFEVPVDFLLQRPPFDYWEAINADRRGRPPSSRVSAVQPKMMKRKKCSYWLGTWSRYQRKIAKN